MPLNNLGPLDIIGGLVLAMVVTLFVFVGQFALAYSRTDDDVSKAAMMTGRWTIAVIGGAFGLGATGLVQLGDIIGQVFGFTAGHPYFVSNLITIGLGWLGLSGGLIITADQYVGLALAGVGLVLLFVEVDSFAS